MNWFMWEAAMRERASLSTYKARIESARALIDEALAHCERPYIAYSGGKDSQVLLDLVLRICPDIWVVWHDEDWVYPETLDLLEQVETSYCTRILRVRERKAADEFAAEFSFFPRCSRPRPVDFEADTWAEIVEHFGFDGVFLGLRRDESAQRRYALKTPLRLQKRDQLWHCSPLFDWKLEDVWTYLLSEQLPVHPVYRTMMESGVEPRYARVGPLTAIRVWRWGALEFAKRHYPDLWRDFLEDNPEVNARG